jgi:hypothetical protein
MSERKEPARCILCDDASKDMRAACDELMKESTKWFWQSMREMNSSFVYKMIHTAVKKNLPKGVSYEMFVLHHGVHDIRREPRTFLANVLPDASAIIAKSLKRRVAKSK